MNFDYLYFLLKKKSTKKQKKLVQNIFFIIARQIDKISIGKPVSNQAKTKHFSLLSSKTSDKQVQNN